MWCVSISRNIIHSVTYVRICSKVCVKAYWINTFRALKHCHLQRQVLMLQEHTHTVDSVAECRNPEYVCAHIALPLAFDFVQG